MSERQKGYEAMQVYELTHHAPCVAIVADETKKSGRRWCSERAIMGVVDGVFEGHAITRGYVRTLCYDHFEDIAWRISFIDCESCVFLHGAHFIDKSKALVCPRCKSKHCGLRHLPNDVCEMCRERGLA